VTGRLPAWAEEMRRIYRSGSASQFILYGNVFDLVAAPGPGEGSGGRRFLALRHFLTRAMFEPFDVVLHYDRGRGIRVRKGGDHFQSFLKAFDAFRGTSWAGVPEKLEAARKAGKTPVRAGEGAADPPLELGNLLPRDPVRALELLDRFLRASRYRTRLDEDGQPKRDPLQVAVMLDYAQFLAPRGEALHLSGPLSETLIRLLDWGGDPALADAPVATVLVTENLADLHASLVESPYAAKLRIALPDASEIREYVEDLTAGETNFESVCELPLDVLAAKLVGLSRVNVRGVLLRALRGGERLTQRYLTEIKKELIEKDASGRIEFIESTRSLDDVAGHQEAKRWLRQDAELLRRGRHRAIPMGYLLCGRIGTGKTFLVECWAGEVGIPVVEIKNFRERWVGATEGNLERIFHILHALGQVVVFVDEADQATGKRDAGDADSGLSGRIYGMLAAEMSDTRNRGKILWVFATSRPDLLEVDLKRQGRLDVHIPLFPPGDPESRHELFYAMARKLGLEITREELPQPPADADIGGNEMEGILVRALRLYETQPEGEEAPEPATAGRKGRGKRKGKRDEARRRTLAEIIEEVLETVRPSAHVERLALMDLLAVKECTDAQFLPPRFAKLPLTEVNRRIEALRLLVG
jgi:hypothetical protein